MVIVVVKVTVRGMMMVVVVDSDDRNFDGDDYKKFY